MRQLIDTHVLIWFLRGEQNLSETARTKIESDEAENLVSLASLWEMAIKLSLGKLDLKRSFEQVKEDIEINGFILLPIQFQHLQSLISLPYHHRDPFDRLLIAQAQAEQIPLISADEKMNLYQISRIW